MADHDKTVAAVHHNLNKLDADPVLESERILRILNRLDRLPITVRVLQETGVGKAVNKLRKRGGKITEAVKQLVQSWKELVREAMEAEEKTQASPECEPSPSPQSGTSDEESGDESEESDDSSSSSSSESEDEIARNDYSPEPSSPCGSFPSSPTTPQPIRDSTSKPSSNQHLLKDRDSRTGKEKVPSKRSREPSPSRCQDLPKTSSSTTSSSHIKKRRTEERHPSDTRDSSKVVKKKPPEDDSFSQALFPSPRKIGGSSASSLTRSPVQKQKQREGDQTGSPSKLTKPGKTITPSSSSLGNTNISEKNLKANTQKKIYPNSDQGRTKAKASDSRVISSSVKESESSFLDMVDDVDESFANHKSTSCRTNKVSSQVKTTSVSKPSMSASPSTKTSSQKKPGSASLKTPTGFSESSRTAKKPAQSEHGRIASKNPKTLPSSNKVSSKSESSKTSMKSNDDSESKSISKKNPAPKVKRKLSSGERRISEGDKTFDNTGLSFGDILMGPVSTSNKVKKPGKPLNTGATDSSKKSSMSSSSKKPSSKQSSSSHDRESSSSKHVSHKESKSASTSGSGSKKVSSNDERRKRWTQVNDPMSSMQKLEDIHQEITFNLPEISADYKPLRLPEVSPKKKVGGLSEEGSYIGSKHQRTKLYSGRARQTVSSVPTLFDACMRILMDNIDSLYVIGVPYFIIKPVLEKCTPQQLLQLEDYNQYLIEDTDDLWKSHAEKDFRKYKPQEMETWRELYLRKMDEREEKLKNLTANISASMAKSKDQERLTKMAFVNGPAKPPRNIKRQQARHGTGRITSNPPSNPHKPYVPSKHAGDQGPIRSSSTSTIKSGDYSPGRSHSGGGGGSSSGDGGGGGSGGTRGNPSYESISLSGCNGSTSNRGRAKPKAPMMQKALRMKKMFRR
ncbi:transcription elongation factor B polypeptide 3-like [Lytechinus variegatus]|uniref:transcription elongation factor B polypeptide 3-like n=1 Tax=Lytechinus variegatus TaxID=7654 RepID=UPI001BB0FD63|nr:transcription elongation factor B polypeptide 3-like [Lytechinus variegatus]